MTQSTEQSSSKRVHLHYLDGLRGLAALYVVFSHLWELQENNVPSLWLVASNVFRYGIFSVSVFIVLSGYCLMLPIVRSQTSYISGSLLDYFKRRSRRILPPYYAALLISIAAGLIITILVKFHIFSWNDDLWGHFSRNFTFGDVIYHLLLIHNLTPGDKLFHINGPMWSVATEWQIYFIFPLMLLPIWRRLGLFFVVIIAFFLGLIPNYLLHGLIDLAHPWYLGLFALGMAAADIGFSQKQSLIRMRSLLPWSWLATIFFGFALLSESPEFGIAKIWMTDSFVGLAAACLLIYCTNCVIDSKAKPLILRVLQSSWAIALGTFSYSLYLLHVVVITPINQYLHSLHLSPIKTDVILYAVSLPASLLLAYLFYLVFERPFMSKFLKKRKVKDTIISSDR
ncbi:MAG: acyltransferase [Iphinoe sp. HA4291-MV1]|nr:acyltransferase [Iphinoe sp. HA4291-MV1]